jgi:PAS domain S-box-containing protein
MKKLPLFSEIDRRLLEKIASPVTLQDREHTILWANSAAAEVAGRTPDELIGVPCYEALFGRKSPCESCPVEKAWESASVENAIVFPKNGAAWMINGYPIPDENGDIITVVEKSEDITHQYLMERKLKQIRDLSKSLVLAKDEKEIADLVVDGIQKIIDVPSVNVWLVEGDMLVRKSYRSRLNLVPPKALPLDSPKGVIVEVVRKKTPVYVPDTSKNERYLGDHKSEICVPILSGEEVLGVINVESDRENAFDRHYFTYLQTLADQAALAIKNARMFRSLKESEEFHRTALETIADPVVVIDPDFKVVFWNRGARRTFGYSKKEALGKLVHEVIEVSDGESKFKQAIERAQKRGKACYPEVEVRRKDGTTAIVSLAVTSMGQNGSFVIAAKDVTEVKIAEKELSESEERFREIFEESPIGMFQSTPEGKLLNINKTLAKMLGFNRKEEGLAQSAWDFYVDPSNRRKWQRLLRRRKRLKGFEIKFRRQDGSIFWGRLNVVGVTDENGQILFYEGSIEDITEKKLAEQALSESELRYRKLVENLPVPLIIHKGDRIVYANLATLRLLDIPDGEGLTGASLNEFIHPDSTIDLSSPTFVSNQKTPPRMEVKMLSKNGRTIEAEVSWIPLTFQEDKALLMAINDVTYERMAMDRLKDSEKKYRTLVENLPAIVYLDSAYDLWSTIYISPQVKDILGFTPEEYMSNPDLWFNQLYPEDRRRAFESVSRAYENLQDFSLEYRMLTKDGKVVWIRDDARL